MPDLDLNIAFWDYDRTRPLMDGRVRPEGINPNITVLICDLAGAKQVPFRGHPSDAVKDIPA
jgi:hypothetical protein